MLKALKTAAIVAGVSFLVYKVMKMIEDRCTSMPPDRFQQIRFMINSAISDFLSSDMHSTSALSLRIRSIFFLLAPYVSTNVMELGNLVIGDLLESFFLGSNNLSASCGYDWEAENEYTSSLPTGQNDPSHHGPVPPCNSTPQPISPALSKLFKLLEVDDTTSVRSLSPVQQEALGKGLKELMGENDNAVCPISLDRLIERHRDGRMYLSDDVVAMVSEGNDGKHYAHFFKGDPLSKWFESQKGYVNPVTRTTSSARDMIRLTPLYY